MAKKYKPILYWSLIDCLIGAGFLLSVVPDNVWGIIGFSILGLSGLSKLIFAALAS